MKKVMTLCLIYEHPKLLLAMKKRGFGVGRWNGFGGKLKEKESVEEGIRREALEEGGIKISEMEKVGILEFEFRGNPEIIETHVFKIQKYEGEPAESEEMRPQWFEIDRIPFDEMWPDDKFWLPLFLEGKRFKGKFLFGEFDQVIEHNLSVLD